MTDQYIKRWIKPEVLTQAAYHVKSAAYRIKLNQNESPWDWPEELKGEISNRIAEHPWNRYPGLIPVNLKIKLAASLSVEPNRIVIGKGSNEILQALFTAALKEGDTVCTLSPTFAVYQLLAEQRKVQMLNSKLNESFRIDEYNLIEKSKQAGITILCNPNSPTGTLISLEIILQTAKAAKGLVVVDEAYVDFSGVTALSFLDNYPNLIITRTFSKAYALAGFRVGYGVMNSGLADEIQKCLLPFNVDIPSAVAAEVLLDNSDIVKKRTQQIVNERDRLIHRLNQLDGVKAWQSHSNFFLLQTSLGSAVTFDRLTKQGILVRDVSSYPGCSEMVRVTVGTPEENQVFLTAVKELL